MSASLWFLSDLPFYNERTGAHAVAPIRELVSGTRNLSLLPEAVSWTWFVRTCIMAKKRKRSALPARKSGPTVRPGNPFEQLYQHKKFDVLGKRFKGDSRKLIKSRADAVDKVSDPGHFSRRARQWHDASVHVCLSLPICVAEK